MARSLKRFKEGNFYFYTIYNSNGKILSKLACLLCNIYVKHKENITN